MAVRETIVIKIYNNNKTLVKEFLVVIIKKLYYSLFKLDVFTQVV